MVVYNGPDVGADLSRPDWASNHVEDGVAWLMVSRARVTDEGSGQYEYFAAYRENLKQEAKALKRRLRGFWFWKHGPEKVPYMKAETIAKRKERFNVKATH
jgi:hypothetical protein